jgi:hypothetical protein
MMLTSTSMLKSRRVITGLGGGGDDVPLSDVSTVIISVSNTISYVRRERFLFLFGSNLFFILLNIDNMYIYCMNYSYICYFGII